MDNEPSNSVRTRRSIKLSSLNPEKFSDYSSNLHENTINHRSRSASFDRQRCAFDIVSEYVAESVTTNDSYRGVEPSGNIKSQDRFELRPRRSDLCHYNLNRCPRKKNTIKHPLSTQNRAYQTFLASEVKDEGAILKASPGTEPLPPNEDKENCLGSDDCQAHNLGIQNQTIVMQSSVTELNLQNISLAQQADNHSISHLANVHKLIEATAIAGCHLYDNGGNVDPSIVSHVTNALSPSTDDKLVSDPPFSPSSSPTNQTARKRILHFRNPFLHTWESSPKQGWRARRVSFLNSLPPCYIQSAKDTLPLSSRPILPRCPKELPRKRQPAPKRDITMLVSKSSFSTSPGMQYVKPCLLGFRSVDRAFRQHEVEREAMILWL